MLRSVCSPLKELNVLSIFLHYFKFAQGQLSLRLWFLFSRLCFYFRAFFSAIVALLFTIIQCVYSVTDLVYLTHAIKIFKTPCGEFETSVCLTIVHHPLLPSTVCTDRINWYNDCNRLLSATCFYSMHKEKFSINNT